MSERDKPWTPGPWYFDVFGTVTTHPPRKGLRSFMPTTGIVAKCQQIWQERAHHDARLISCTPELLEALEENNEILNEAMDKFLESRMEEGFVGEEMMNRWYDNEALLNKIYGTEP